jgi:methionine--tRNA ligase beta chain
MLLKRLLNYLLGYCVIKVEGSRKESFINLVINAKIPLWDIVQKDADWLWAKVYVTDISKLRHIARKSRCPFKIVDKKGFPFIALRAEKRKGLVVGIILFTVTLYWLSSFIWFVDVFSNQPLELVSEEKILAEAARLGIRPGALKSRLSTDKIEHKLAVSLPQLTFVSIELEGTLAKIEVVEKKVIDEQNKEKPAHLVAAKDGIIEEILVLSGNPRASVGDTVQKGQVEPLDEELKVIAKGLPKQVDDALNKFEFSTALSAIWKLVNKANKYIEETAPWALAKDPAKTKRLHTVMYNLVEAIRISTVFISPFMPNTPAKVWAQLGLSEHTEAHTWESILSWGGTPSGVKISRGEPIFPRIEEEKDDSADTHKGKDTKKVTEKKEEQVKEELANVISIEDFAKVELRVAEVVEAKKVEKADKLLELKVRIGEEERTIVAGIALYYTPEELVGKKIVVVYNLKPAKLRGITSQGMLLAASEGDKLAVLTLDKDVPSGARVK